MSRIRREPFPGGPHKISPKYQLSEDDKEFIKRHNANLGFIWSDDLQQYITKSSVISETNKFFIVNGKKVMKPEALKYRRAHRVDGERRME